MKFIDWYNFNFVDNKVMNNFGDIYVKVMRKHSFRSEDVMLDTLMNTSDAVKVFGDYQLIQVNLRTEKNYDTIGVLVCKE